MDINDLTVSQLKRAAAIKEQIEALNKELRGTLVTPSGTRPAKKNRTMSATVKRKIAASQRAR
jgi:hypothetical protein